MVYYALNWIIGTGLALWVYQDATRRRAPHGIPWALFTFFFWAFGFAGYLYMTRVAMRLAPAQAPLPDAGGPVGRRGTGRLPGAARTPTGRLGQGAPAPAEPKVISRIEDLFALITLATNAIRAGRQDEVTRLMGRVFDEAALADLPIIMGELTAAWLKSVRPHLPAPVAPVIQAFVEEAVEAARVEEFAKAVDLMTRAATPTAQVAGQHPGALLVIAGLDGALAARARGGDGDDTISKMIKVAVHEMTLPGKAAVAHGLFELAAAMIPESATDERSEARRVRIRMAMEVCRARMAEEGAAGEVAVAGDAAVVGDAPAAGDEPVTVDGWIARGHALLDTNPALALTCYGRATQLDPDDGGGWAGQAMTLRHLGRHAEAIPFYDRLVALRPDEAEFWFQRADCLEVAGRLAESLASYDEALARDPQMAPAWVDRGHVLGRLKRPQEALASHVRALEIAPDKFEAWFNRAEQERVLGMRDAAMVSYRRFLALAPADRADLVAHARKQLTALEAQPAEAAWQQLAREAEARAAADDLTAGEALYLRAIAAEPAQAAKLYHNLAMMYLRRDREAEAERFLREAVARDAAQALSWEVLAKLYRRRLQIPEALEAYTRLAALRPADPDTLGMLADLQHRLGHYEAALATLARFEPTHPHLLRLRGTCLFALGKPQEALQALAAIADDELEVHIDRGLCLERLGRKEEAIASYERGHVMSGRKWFHLARLQPDHAKDYYGRAVEALSAVARVDGLDKISATELAYARKKLTELDPARLAEFDAYNAERRAELQAQGRSVG